MGNIETNRSNLRRFYPELAAGGFTRVDGSVAFYARVNALIEPDMIVLDYGAGRGAQLQDRGAPFRTELAKLQGKVRRLVGIDVDPAVLENPFLDEAFVVDPKGSLPFENATFDLVFADWVLEHVDTPSHFAAEVRRILKPGGWFCARTPNRWGMTGIGANLLPNRLHAKILQHLQYEREARDVFPTAYKLNTLRRLRAFFLPGEWENFSFFYNPEPPYIQRSRLLIRLARLFFRLAPSSMATDMHVLLRKR